MSINAPPSVSISSGCVPIYKSLNELEYSVSKTLESALPSSAISIASNGSVSNPSTENPELLLKSKSLTSTPG